MVTPSTLLMAENSDSVFTIVVTTIGVIAQFLYNDPTMSVIFAGMAGGAVRWFSEKEPWKVGISSVIIGGICAKYLGPFTLGLLERIFGISISDEAGTTGAFAMGLGGILIIKYIMDKMKSYTEKDSNNSNKAE